MESINRTRYQFNVKWLILNKVVMYGLDVQDKTVKL